MTDAFAVEQLARHLPWALRNSGVRCIGAPNWGAIATSLLTLMAKNGFEVTIVEAAAVVDLADDRHPCRLEHDWDKVLDEHGTLVSVPCVVEYHDGGDRTEVSTCWRCKTVRRQRRREDGMPLSRPTYTYPAKRRLSLVPDLPAGK